MEKTEEDKVKVFSAGHCRPCDEIKELLKKGQFLVDGEEGKAELVDIETEEGFSQVEEVDLETVPVAYRGKKQCKISIDDETETLLIECNENKEP